MPPGFEPRRPVSASKSWRERPRRRARGVAPRLSGRVVHATTCLSVSERCGVTDSAASTRRPLTMDLASDHERILQVDPIHVHNGFLRRIARQICAASDRARTGPAGTFVSVELCSTPSRFCASLRPRWRGACGP